MSGATVTRGTPGPRRATWSWMGNGLVAVGRGLAFCVLMLAGLGPLLAVALVLVLALVLLRAFGGHPDGAFGGHPDGPHVLRLGLLPVLLVGSSVLTTRRLAGLTRRLAGKWCGMPIASPYRPLPRVGASEEVSLWQWLRRRLRWLLTDPASWRDLLWMLVDACGGWVLAAAPAVMVLYGLVYCVAPALGLPVTRVPYVGLRPPTGPGALLLGVALVAAGLWVAPRLLRAYGGLARLMLAPTTGADLASQVAHLARTRSDTIDTGAAEMRRIERDLHDGAQARLVAMGMTLSAAEELMDTSPVAARALLLEARESSAKALAELRDLVRGIHPPVLADRGLAEAVHALALDSPLRVHLAGELPGRLPAPVESAAYFAVNELLANVSKHASAGQAWIDIRHEHGMLRIGVTDDGRGGADPVGGTGLRGIERRLAAFDGVLALSSPIGGPTVVNMEIPCALSSPKTSSCSETV